MRRGESPCLSYDSLPQFPRTPYYHHHHQDCISSLSTFSSFHCQHPKILKLECGMMKSREDILYIPDSYMHIISVHLQIWIRYREIVGNSLNEAFSRQIWRNMVLVDLPYSKMLKIWATILATMGGLDRYAKCTTWGNWGFWVGLYLRYKLLSP